MAASAPPKPVPAPPGATAVVPALHWSDREFSRRDETVAEERPLAIEVAYERGGQRVRKLLGVTMRTPGHDEELALGFLHAEGVVAGATDATAFRALAESSRGEKLDCMVVELSHPPAEDLTRVSRSLLTSSACGLCGRAGLAGLPLGGGGGGSRSLWDPALVAELPEKLRRSQAQFERTGGTHGAALADPSGRLLVVREDVGRHNAADKVIGAALRGGIPPAGKGLVLSGRASFELVQKAAAAGIELVVAVGAPSSLAVQLARETSITLAAFTRAGRFNVYAHADRLSVSNKQPSPAHAARQDSGQRGA